MDTAMPDSDESEGSRSPRFNSYSYIKDNWLTRKPHPAAGLMMALVVLFVVLGSLAYWVDFHGATRWMAASKSLVFGQHEYWRAWTTLFVHGDEKHLLGNVSLMFVLGFFLAGYFGVWLVPLSGLLVGGLVNFWVLSQMPADVLLIGVSGVVFWMGGAWLTLYLLIETRKSLLQRILRSGGVGLALFMPAEAFDRSISYQSHFLGFVLGVVWGIAYYLIRKKPLRAAEVWETRVEEAEEIESENFGSSEI